MVNLLKVHRGSPTKRTHPCLKCGHGHFWEWNIFALSLLPSVRECAHSGCRCKRYQSAIALVQQTEIRKNIKVVNFREASFNRRKNMRKR